MKDLTEFTSLKIHLTRYSKSKNNLFSVGRARVFYLGPNPNRTIITEEVADQLISSIGGTPIVGYFNAEKDDFEGHEANQSAYGFVPLEPNVMKSEVIEEVLGIPVKRTYYEVDVVIWDGRFREAAKVLEEQKSLSMELNPETIQGEYEIYGEEYYLRFTNAEFIGITILGNDKTPCFKDARFFEMYKDMVSAYQAFMTEEYKSEKNKGGTDMSVIDEKVETPTVEETEVIETTETIETEEIVDSVEPEVEAEADNAEVETEEVEEEAVSEEEVEEVVEETEEVEAEEEPSTEPEEGTEEPSEDTEALEAKVEELEEKLETYEKAEKEALLNTFAKKISDEEFIKNINIADYTVEGLKAALSAKLADQVLAEETTEESSAMNYSFSNLIKKNTGSWEDLVRASKRNN